MANDSDTGLVTLAEGVHAFIGEGGDSNAGVKSGAVSIRD